jgi:hypothetical protein
MITSLSFSKVIVIRKIILIGVGLPLQKANRFYI